MGGFGSGRQGGKGCTDNLRRLDVRQIQRAGCLRPGTPYGWQWSSDGEVVASIQVTAETDRVWLAYRRRQQGDEWRDMRYPVLLDRTRCHLGGERVWWRCPAVGCGRRAAVLFGGGVFACRHCHGLAYRCQRETPGDRVIRQADKTRQRLGWDVGILNPSGGKPKGMHWRTFERLTAKHDAYVDRAMLGIAERFGIPLHK